MLGAACGAGLPHVEAERSAHDVGDIKAVLIGKPFGGAFKLRIAAGAECGSLWCFHDGGYNVPQLICWQG